MNFGGYTLLKSIHRNDNHSIQLLHLSARVLSVSVCAKMKTGLKSFVRAISPFTKAKSSEGAPPSSKTAVNEFFWDLSKVDMVAMLSNFYTTYNPERVRSVHEILHQYEGEEVLMLQQLCERYNLSEPDIQAFLDNALLGRKDKDKFSNWIKKKSEGSVTFTDPDSKEVAGSTGAGSVQGSKEARPRSGYSGFVWDLSNADLSKALKLLYRAHNPQKTPNVASLENKTENEKVLLLQQLCKRHNLNQAEMQVFLDKARNKEENSHGNIGNKTRYGSKGKNSGNVSATASDDGSQASKTGSLRKSGTGSDVAASILSSFQKHTSKPSIADIEDFMTEQQTDKNIITGGQQRQGSLPFWQNAFPLSVAGASSPPPPPPPPPLVFGASPVTAGGRPPTASHSSGQSTSPVGSVAGSVTSSVTAGSRFGPAEERVLERGNSRSNSKVSSSYAPSLASLSLSRAGSMAGASRDEEPSGTNSQRGEGARARAGATNFYDVQDSSPMQGHADTSVSNSHGLPTVSRSNSRTSSSRVIADTADAGGSRSAEGARAAELLDLQRELSEARLQVVGAKKENLALAKALQSSQQRQTDAQSLVSELSGHQAHLDQVPDVLAELAKLKNLLTQQEGEHMPTGRLIILCGASEFTLSLFFVAYLEREAALKRQYGQLKQQLQGLQGQVAVAQRQCEDARGDARDVLRLVDIMSASPAGIKSVLEAYLKQLGMLLSI